MKHRETTVGIIIMEFYTDHNNVVRPRQTAIAKTANRVENLVGAVLCAGIVCALLWIIVLTAAGGAV